MRNMFSSRFAENVTVRDAGGSRSARAFLRPVSVTSPEAPALSPAGMLDERRWRIILEPISLSGPVTVVSGNTEYLLLRYEMIGGGDHIEGLLCRKAGNAYAG